MNDKKNGVQIVLKESDCIRKPAGTKSEALFMLPANEENRKALVDGAALLEAGMEFILLRIELA